MCRHNLLHLSCPCRLSRSRSKSRDYTSCTYVLTRTSHKLKFRGTVSSYSILASSWHPSEDVRRKSVTRQACQATSPNGLPRAYLIGWPAVCCVYCCPFVRVSVSFSKVHENDTHILRGCHEDAMRKTGPVEFQLYIRQINFCSVFGADQSKSNGEYGTTALLPQ